jgi:hypothetical protein
MKLFRGLLAALVVCALAAPRQADAFWLLGFSTADTLPAGDFAAIAGTGGQYSSVGDPRRSSFTGFLPHAGIRVGITDGLDIGYRLTQVALPFSSVGPSLGGEIDLKYRLTPADSPWQVALVGGMAYSYLEISGQSRDAWSPGIDLVVSHVLSPTYAAITEFRYVYTAIPSAVGGQGGNHLNAAGMDLGMRIRINDRVSLVPEVGLFDFAGQMSGRGANGIGAQYGAVLAFRF